MGHKVLEGPKRHPTKTRRLNRYMLSRHCAFHPNVLGPVKLTSHVRHCLLVKLKSRECSLRSNRTQRVSQS